jgi:hypothetical protein
VVVAVGDAAVVLLLSLRVEGRGEEEDDELPLKLPRVTAGRSR